jgi:fructuronate reductase
VTQRLGADSLAELPALVRRPAYDRAQLKTGIVHLGIGAFHRAHQAVFTEDAIEAGGGDWGILGASLHHAAVPEALAAQDGLYTVECLGEEARYRVVGAIRGALYAPSEPEPLLAAMAARSTHVVTLTVTEKGYCLDPNGALDLAHPDIQQDLARPALPKSALGWLVRGLDARNRVGSAPLTILSCDNLAANGAKLQAALLALAEHTHPHLSAWIARAVAVPNTLVDCIVPAASPAHRARVEQALGFHDEASVQRESFAQWVIENRFAGPAPEWGRAGVEIVEDVEPYPRLKLHILNTCHSALAYLGWPRGHEFVRQAIGDGELVTFCDCLVAEEIAPALAPLDASGYWRRTKRRLANPMLDHRLTQIAEDGSVKLAQRIFPLLIEGAQAGRKIDKLAAIVRAWLAFMAKTPSRDPQNPWLAQWARAGAQLEAALDNPALFPAPFRSDARLRAAVLA